MKEWGGLLLVLGGVLVLTSGAKAEMLRRPSFLCASRQSMDAMVLAVQEADEATIQDLLASRRCLLGREGLGMTILGLDGVLVRVQYSTPDGQVMRGWTIRAAVGP